MSNRDSKLLFTIYIIFYVILHVAKIRIFFNINTFQNKIQMVSVRESADWV